MRRAPKRVSGKAAQVVFNFVLRIWPFLICYVINSRILSIFKMKNNHVKTRSQCKPFLFHKNM